MGSGVEAFGRKSLPGKETYSSLNLINPDQPSLNGLDQKLQQYLDYDNGFFIEAGANDGYSQSNTYFLEKKRAWRGLLVEGIPELYSLAQKRRPQSEVYNYALVSPDYKEKTVKMHYANLMSLVDGSMKTGDQQERHLRSGMEVQKLESTYSLHVPACTLESLLRKYPTLKRIDFLSLDVEGYELQVLQGANLDVYRPVYILVEARFFDEVNSFLCSKDYELIDKLSVHDCLYKDCLVQ